MGVVRRRVWWRGGGGGGGGAAAAKNKRRQERTSNEVGAGQAVGVQQDSGGGSSRSSSRSSSNSTTTKQQQGAGSALENRLTSSTCNLTRIAGQSSCISPPTGHRDLSSICSPSFPCSSVCEHLQHKLTAFGGYLAHQMKPAMKPVMTGSSTCWPGPHLSLPPIPAAPKYPLAMSTPLSLGCCVRTAGELASSPPTHPSNRYETNSSSGSEREKSGNRLTMTMNHSPPGSKGNTQEQIKHHASNAIGDNEPFKEHRRRPQR
ncbi:hypothetical protein EX30DRAFT_251006 [Ascodesmis nigricans]|uniref:Uncharacterized protein n=1 Tax=Ascodesmis nigricans TaxID=341454 RepID=A0A4S2MY13_9PEZI|nr:hypothetical protein EX30DRAFT_251006 [Ascodesmis nigricans]